MEDVELKVEYLRELRQMIHFLDGKDTSFMWKRWNATCESIEKDLGITKPFSVGDIKVQLNTDDVQAIANGLVKKMRHEYTKHWLSGGGAEDADDTNT